MMDCSKTVDFKTECEETPEHEAEKIARDILMELVESVEMAKEIKQEVGEFSKKTKRKVTPVPTEIADMAEWLVAEEKPELEEKPKRAREYSVKSMLEEILREIISTNYYSLTILDPYKLAGYDLLAFCGCIGPLKLNR